LNEEPLNTTYRVARVVEALYNDGLQKIWERLGASLEPDVRAKSLDQAQIEWTKQTDPSVHKGWNEYVDLFLELKNLAVHVIETTLPLIRDFWTAALHAMQLVVGDAIEQEAGLRKLCVADLTRFVIDVFSPVINESLCGSINVDQESSARIKLLVGVLLCRLSVELAAVSGFVQARQSSDPWQQHGREIKRLRNDMLQELRTYFDDTHLNVGDESTQVRLRSLQTGGASASQPGESHTLQGPTVANLLLRNEPPVFEALLRGPMTEPLRWDFDFRRIG
jgi:hypothetical protein